jgi:hypothetical protein
MSFTYNTENWSPKSSNEHAKDILDTANGIIVSNGGTNLLKSLLSNIFWIFCLAVGGMRAVLDQLLYQAQQSFSIQNCDDSQILNLLPIAGTSLIPGAYSVVTLTITASVSGTCFVPVNTKAAFVNGVNFVVTDNVTVLANQTGTVLARADTLGAIAVEIGQLNSFTTNITNLASVTNLSAAIAGKYTETITNVRSRLEKGHILDNTLDGLEIAFKSLPGILDAKVFYNTSNSVNLTLPGGTAVLPRKAYCSLLGTVEDENILAKTFFNHFLTETQGASYQYYNTNSGQLLRFNYTTATSQAVHVKVFIPTGVTLSLSVQNAIKTIITNAQSKVGIAEILNSSFIDSLFIDFTGAEICDSQLSFNGTDWYSRLEVYENKYPLFSTTNITIANLS